MTTTRTVTAAGYRCGVTIHSPEAGKDRSAAVLYLHGGGLLYGERDDLPRPYLDAFLAEGYTLFCLDYPLAPEAPIGAIHRAVLEGWLRLLEEELPARGIGRYFLFGRSAGAYLALILAKGLAEREVLRPAGVLDFYGYYDMADDFVTAPSAYYNTLPEVPRRLVERFFGGEPVTSGPKLRRFSLYIYARQKGAWKELLGGSAVEDPAWSLSPEDIRALPPLFITASSGDQDVPFRVSKALSRQAPRAVMKPVYYLEHDFDRDTGNPEGMRVYRECLEWMAGMDKL